MGLAVKSGGAPGPGKFSNCEISLVWLAECQPHHAFAVEEWIFAGHAQGNAQRLFDLRPEHSQIQARPANGIHDAVVNVEPAGHFRRRQGGHAEVNRVEGAGPAGQLQRFTGRLAAKPAVQARGVGFHADEHQCGRVLDVAGVAREAGPAFLCGNLAHFGDDLLLRRLVVNRGGLDVVNAARLGRRPRRRGHQRGDLQRRRFFQFSRSFHGGKIRIVPGGNKSKAEGKFQHSATPIAEHRRVRSNSAAPINQSPLATAGGMPRLIVCPPMPNF